MNVQNNKIDVIINVFGKPWQTICTLKSLLKYSGNHIDKIYLIEEKEQPYAADISQVLAYFNNIIHYTPITYRFLPRKESVGDLNIQENRYVFRYVFRYTGDIIGDMLNIIKDNIGVGSIGQCWNCPCKSAGVCNGENFNNYEPKASDIDFYIKKYPPNRGSHFLTFINWKKLKPLPECRLNEFACLINREDTVKESLTTSNEPFFFWRL